MSSKPGAGHQARRVVSILVAIGFAVITTVIAAITTAMNTFSVNCQRTFDVVGDTVPAIVENTKNGHKRLRVRSALSTAGKLSTSGGGQIFQTRHFFSVQSIKRAVDVGRCRIEAELRYGRDYFFVLPTNGDFKFIKLVHGSPLHCGVGPWGLIRASALKDSGITVTCVMSGGASMDDCGLISRPAEFVS